MEMPDPVEMQSVIGAAHERIRQLEAEANALRAEIVTKDHALEELGRRLVDVERARALGAADVQEARQRAELELRVLQATKLYRFLLRPRQALYRYRRNLSMEA